MDKEERKRLDENIGKAFCKRAKAARSGDNASLTMKVCSRLNGGKTIDTDGTIDAGYVPCDEHSSGRVRASPRG